MKRLLLTLCLFLPLLASAQEALAPQDFNISQGTDSRQDLPPAELYTMGDYLGAALKYSAEIEGGNTANPYLYYNLANSYFKAGDHDKAIANYYRAFRLMPRDKDIRGNLAFALSATGQRLLPEGTPQAAFNLYYYFSNKELKGLTWLFVWVFALVLCVFVFSSGRFYSKQGLIAAAAFLAVFALWYAARSPADNERLAVATAARAEVRSGPGENFPVSLSIPRAFLVTVTDTKGDWAEVEVKAENSNGWVLKKSIEEI